MADATFTEDEVTTLKLVFGYGSIPNLLTTELIQPRPQIVIDRALALVAELTEIDGQLSAARQDSMAKQVDKLTLNYAQHVAHLKSEGSRILKELGQLLGVEVIYNKYKGGSSISARSYW